MTIEHRDPTPDLPSASQQVSRSWWGRLLVGRHPKRTLLRAAILALIVFALCKWIFIPVRITGSSMEPTYQSGNIRLVNRLAYRHRTPQRGDIVSIRKKGRLLTLMKRIVGLPGETVQLRGGRTYINGMPLNEPFIKGNQIPSMARPEILQADEYYVVGDNRNVSDHGVIRSEDILGKVMF